MHLAWSGALRKHSLFVSAICEAWGCQSPAWPVGYVRKPARSRLGWWERPPRTFLKVIRTLDRSIAWWTRVPPLGTFVARNTVRDAGKASINAACRCREAQRTLGVRARQSLHSNGVLVHALLREFARCAGDLLLSGWSEDRISTMAGQGHITCILNMSTYLTSWRTFINRAIDTSATLSTK